MLRAKADKFGSASAAAKLLRLQPIASCSPEKPDMYWSAPPEAKKPVISVVETGYVRRSELKTHQTSRSSSSAHADDPVSTERRIWHGLASIRYPGITGCPA